METVNYGRNKFYDTGPGRLKAKSDLHVNKGSFRIKSAGLLIKQNIFVFKNALA
jgi:hypothetical protein